VRLWGKLEAKKTVRRGCRKESVSSRVKNEQEEKNGAREREDPHNIKTTPLSSEIRCCFERVW